MMYKPGQLILFRSDLEININYGDITFISDMQELKGTLDTIATFDKEDNTFTIKEDGQKYWYSIEMLIF